MSHGINGAEKIALFEAINLVYGNIMARLGEAGVADNSIEHADACHSLAEFLHNVEVTSYGLIVDDHVDYDGNQLEADEQDND